MPAFYTLGRILFAVLFVVAGASKLADVAAATQMVAAKVVLPAQLAPYVTQIETMAKMPIAQLMAIASGALEVAGGLLIALNFGARFVAWIMILFVMAATFYFHDFWNMTGPDKVTNMFQALKNLSIIGALLMISAWPRPASQAVEPAYGNV